MSDAREAAAAWLESALDHGESVTTPTPADAYRKTYKGWIQSLVESARPPWWGTANHQYPSS